MARGEELEGVVEQAMPQGLYRIVLADKRKLTAAVQSVTRQTIVRVIPGDRVLVEISPIDPSRGKITRRLK